MSLLPGENVVNFTGDTPSSFTVSANGTVTAYVFGAAGYNGGGGGFVQGTFNVTSGDTIYANVGGKGGQSTGGYNGGGNGYYDSFYGSGGSGGGFSSVGLSNDPPYLLIAGGGGGGGYDLTVSGAGGGGTSGGSIEGGAGGGTQTGGGAPTGTGSSAGSLYMGGYGVSGGTSRSGGGGGGYYGGGGGRINPYSGGGGSFYAEEPTVYDIIVADPLLDGTSSGAASDYYEAGIGDSLSGSGNGRIVLVYTENIVCFLKGTLVKTPSGHVPIEHVTTNSYVNNQYNEPVKVIYTTSRTFSYAEHPDVMYKIPKNALGNTRDLFITKQHPFFIKGERKEARDLGFSVASESEVADGNGNITVYNISIVDGNTKNLILVNGACEIGTGE